MLTGRRAARVGHERSLGGKRDGQLPGAAAFENQLHGQSCGGAGNPPVSCTNEWCNCQSSYTGNILTRESSAQWYSGMNLDSVGNCTQPWGENMIVSKMRSAGCPAGWVSSGGDPDRPCVLPLWCEKCLGNPVNVANGVKMQREADYTSPAPGGLSFVRYFNNAGMYDMTARLPVVGDYWRHGYSARIVPFDANAYVMAVAQRADGTLRVFKLDGAEMHNRDGAAWRLQKLTDGGGNLTGWRLTTAEADVELYDAQGRLASIATRAGFATTLSYDASGRLTTVADGFGRSLALGYDSGATDRPTSAPTISMEGSTRSRQGPARARTETSRRSSAMTA